MGKTLQEQLQSLCVTGKGGKAEKKTENQKKSKSFPQKQHPPQESKVIVKKQPAPVLEERDLLGKQIREKREVRERENELERQEKLQRRAKEQEVKQLIEEQRLKRPEDGIAYRFNVSGTIRRIFVTQEMADQLSDGRLAIVVQGEGCELLPAEATNRLRTLNDRLMIIHNRPAEGKDGSSDDPYGEYQVPDDLTW
jgi:uncharacterized protein YaiL (DUF2058 family)